MGMKYLSIPHLDKKASQIFLGTGWFAAPNQDQIFQLLDDYFIAGGNVIDTGRFYSGGEAEGVIAKWLDSRNMAAKRDAFMIVNKACHHYVDSNGVHYPEKSRVKPECITEDLEYSLENMKQKYFDIYLLHRDNMEEPVEGLVDRLERHRGEGKILAYGVSNWSLERVQAATDYAKKKGYQGISINNPSYSLATISQPRWFGCVYADDAYIAWHNNKNISVLAWSPQAAGFFAEVFGGNPPADVRQTYFNKENFEKLKRCKELAVKYGVAPTNIALAYVFSQDVPVMASVGARNKPELDEAIKTLDLRLTKQEVAWLALRCGGAVPYKEK